MFSDYSFEVFDEPGEIIDERIDREIARAQRRIILDLGLTADDIGLRDEEPDFEFDGRVGVRISFVISDEDGPAQWLYAFHDHERSVLQISSEPYYGG